MFFDPRLAKNHRIIFYFYYKQKSKIFSIDINNWNKINGVNNRFDSFIIKPLYLFGFNQML